MSEQAKVYAKSATTVFYDLNKNLITKLHAPKEWNPFDLNQFGKGDFLGVTTGVEATANGYNLLQIEHTHDHQLKVGGIIPISNWRPMTFLIYVREDQVTVDAPPTEEEKKEMKQAEKDKKNKELIDSINQGDPSLTGSGDTKTGSSNIIVFVVLGVILIGVLLWAFLSGKKSKPVEAAPIIVLPKSDKQKPQVIDNNSVSPLQPQTTI